MKQTKNILIGLDDLLELSADLGNYKNIGFSLNNSIIDGNRYSKNIINLSVISESIKKAIKLIQVMNRQKSTRLLVITRNNFEFKEESNSYKVGNSITVLARRCKAGLLTNWNLIKSRMFKLRVMYNIGKLKSEHFILLTKHHYILELRNLPTSICVLDIYNSNTCIVDAFLTKIPSIVFCNTDARTTLITYPVYLNTNSYLLMDLINKLIINIC